MSQVFDYIVVGSGCSGAIVAQTLLEHGKRVAMVDVGESNPTYQTAVPNKSYLELRETDKNQYTYFIGEHGEGVVNDLGKGAQLTPTRKHLLQNVDSFIPLRSDSFKPIESLGYGGLGIGWGLQCWEFSRHEITRAGMDDSRMIPAYEKIAAHIGVSATDDSAARYTLNELHTYQPSPTLDRNMQRVSKSYERHQRTLNKAGFYMGRTPLALITKDMEGRKKYAYRDMDFYDDNDKSAWRPWIVIDALRKNNNFIYINNFLATRFSEKKLMTTIHGIDTKTKKEIAYDCKKLILATGALGSARIALRSLEARPGTKIPFLCNPYTYVPSIQPPMFGQPAEPKKVGFGQLSGFLSREETEESSSILTLYSYQSLMLFRIIRQLPLNFNDARSLVQYLSSGMIVAGIQHSDAPSSRKYLQLNKNTHSLTGDELRATYILGDEERAAQQVREKQYIRALRRVGLFALKRMALPSGASVHYAGTLPFSTTEKPYCLDPRGRVYGTKNVYVADSSGFTFLPARGLTFSILANALITAENVL